MKSKSLLLIGATLAAVGATAPAYATTVVVTPTSMENWSFDNRDVNGVVGANPNGTGAIVSGPAAPPLGTGSANLAVGDGTSGGDGTEELRNTGYAGTHIADLTALSYSTYDTLNNGQQFPYLGLMVSFTGGSTPDDILFFEPPYQTPATGNGSLANEGDPLPSTWQSWDALAGGWWDSEGILNCSPGTGVKSLSTCLGPTLYSTTTIVNAGALGGVRFNVGFTDPGDQFNGYVDDFTIGVNGVNTTYDFDPAAAVPEPATWAMFLLGFGAIGWTLRHRRTSAATV